MIAAEPSTRHTAAHPGWQQELAAAVRDPVELLSLLGLAPAALGLGVTAESLREAALQFPLRVPRGFIARMQPGNPRDPLLLQTLSLPVELLEVPGYVHDALDEATVREAPGLLHKYQGRALLVTTGACAVHCRYCFRRHYDYQPENEDRGAARWAQALAHIRADASFDEVILSGGDPLSLSNARLAQLLCDLAAIAHVQRIRIHTRTPVVLPSRVDTGLIDALTQVHERLAIVVHVNHAAELDDSAQTALRTLRTHCTALLNQSVLLAGINDDATILADLSQRLLACGVVPYYLHQLDRVAGAAHFAVSDERALQLHAALTARLSGYLVPRLVREIPGASGKTLIVNGNSGET